MQAFLFSAFTGCLSFIKKNIPEILVGNFRSVRTVLVVYHLPKISGLTRRARLDFSAMTVNKLNGCLRVYTQQSAVANTTHESPTFLWDLDSFSYPEPLGLICNNPRDQETTASGDENDLDFTSKKTSVGICEILKYFTRKLVW